MTIPSAELVCGNMNIPQNDPTTALSPLDGRYSRQTRPLAEYLSEPALNRTRIFVEVEWLITMTETLPSAPHLTEQQKGLLRSLPTEFDEQAAIDLKAIEKITHHDVKAVEYYIDRALDHSADAFGGADYVARLKALVHFGCTSEDINNLAYALTIRKAVNEIWLPHVRTVIDTLASAARHYADLPMLAMTHGQPASPTTLGKELAVYVYRLERQIHHIEAQEYLGKLNGATGTFGAFAVADPQIDWLAVSRDFVENRLHLTWNPLTTQIESHDWQIELFDSICHINHILHGFCVDMWLYISRGIVSQIPCAGAVGSSTMPHKVNPILFENAEANFELSCGLFTTLCTTLAETRWQRDLTDSTTQRNIGSALGYSLLAITSLGKGLGRVRPNKEKLAAELQENWEVLGEPIQTVMRAQTAAGSAGLGDAYERVKTLMRGKTIRQSDVEDFIRSLPLPIEEQKRLLNLTPESYIGLAPQLVTHLNDQQ